MTGTRILLQRIGFHRQYEREGGAAFVYDASSFAYLIEEAVARAAIRVAVTGSAATVTDIEALAQPLRDRVEVVDQDGRVRREALAFLRPIADELGVDMQDLGAITHSGSLPRLDIDAFAAIWSDLYPFLLGAHDRLQVDVSIPGLLSGTRALRTRLTNPDSRARLAALEGLLTTYQPSSIPTLQFVGAAPEEQVRLFLRLCDDAAYRALSHESLLLGAVDGAGRGIHMIGRRVTDLLRSQRFQSVLGVGSKLVRVPLPDGPQIIDALQAWRLQSYLPPIVPLSDLYLQARAHWIAAPFPQDPNNVQLGKLGGGWRLVPFRND